MREKDRCCERYVLRVPGSTLPSGVRCTCALEGSDVSSRFSAGSSRRRSVLSFPEGAKILEFMACAIPAEVNMLESGKKEGGDGRRTGGDAFLADRVGAYHDQEAPRRFLGFFWFRDEACHRLLLDGGRLSAVEVHAHLRASVDDTLLARERKLGAEVSGVEVDRIQSLPA